MKAEPESRLENGIDVAFSIDHLAAKTEPEPWDGMKKLLTLAALHIDTDVAKESEHTQVRIAGETGI